MRAHTNQADVVADALEEAARIVRASHDLPADFQALIGEFARRFDAVIERSDDERVRISRALSRTVEVQMTAPIRDVGGVRPVMRYRPILADFTPTERQAA